MSLFGRAVAGAGAGAANIASQYIDADIQAQKAQMLADIQHAAFVRNDEYMQSEPRQEALRRNEGAMLDARNAAALRGRVNEESSPELQGQIINNLRNRGGVETDIAVNRENQMTVPLVDRARQLGETAGDVERSNAAAFGKDPNAIAGVRARAQAAHVEDSGAGLRNQLLQHAVDRQNAIDKLYAEFDQVSAADIPTDQKKVQLRAISDKIALLNQREGKTQRDPELDTETVTEEKMNPDGTTTKTTRKQVRRPGGETAGATPDGIPDLSAALAKGREERSALAGVKDSPIAGRPYLQATTAALNRALKEDQLSGRERNDILQELERRKNGDMQ